jgi:hypothetical protein
MEGTMGKIDTNRSRAAMHVIDDHICENCLTRPIMSIEFTDDDVLRLHWRLHAVDMRHEKTMVLPRTIRRLRAWAIVTAFCCSGGRRSDGAFCHLTPPSLHTFNGIGHQAYERAVCSRLTTPHRFYPPTRDRKQSSCAGTREKHTS